MTTLVLEEKDAKSCDKTREKSYDKTMYSIFIWTQKQKQLLIKTILMMYSNQSIVILYETWKNLQDKVPVELLIKS